MIYLGKVVFAVFVFAVVVPLDIFPLIGNVFAAFGAFIMLFPHIGSFKFAVGIVVFLSTLTHKYAFAEPPESCCSGFCFSHMTDGPPPSFVPKQPTYGTALEVGLVIRAQQPKRHSV